MQKFRTGKIAFFITPIILLSGLNFCFVNIQIVLGATLDSPKIASVDTQPVVESCTDNNILGEAAASPTIKEKSEPTTDNSKGSLPLCCLNHNNDNTANIETVKNQGTNNSLQPLTTEIYNLNYKLALADTFNIYTLGLSPPSEDPLSSIIKKE